MISYQLFTQIAVATVLTYIAQCLPSIGAWLATRIGMIVFVYAFSWAFILSSVIPSIILGRERGVLVQFLIVLVLTFVAFTISDILAIVYSFGSIDQILGLAVLFKNPILAVGYLSVPYILMLVIDIRSRIRRRIEKEVEGIPAETLQGRNNHHA